MERQHHERGNSMKCAFISTNPNQELSLFGDIALLLSQFTDNKDYVEFWRKQNIYKIIDKLPKSWHN